ncbi:Vesicle coat complex AP-1/AP-2/AP-4, beta subunit [Trachipleistophora hominis]|uniref:Vesicle coat complex AP-1/AP-2/AP-4, beta subunit n=1 Tax=Trachipleistophora hominis TaxID=72359 RepID=L7JWP2_TRAHO|nr:Vesicle coat complex AP-1/AP-2/AP-4, beta subunit [Trachipleistophora hominis]
MFTDKLLDKLMNVINKQMAGTKIQLDNPTPNQLRDSMMVLTRKMHTEDVSSYLTKVIRHIDTPNLFIKSLINYYLINIKHNTTVLMLIINTTLKDLSDNDYFKIQGLRVATNIKNSDIQQFFVARIHKLMSDRNFVVRLCSVIASISIFEQNYDKFMEYKFGEQLMRMMGDSVLAVRECVLMAISTTDVEVNLELFVSNFEKRSENERIAILRIMKKRLERAKEGQPDFRMVEEDDNGDLISISHQDGRKIRDNTMCEEHNKKYGGVKGTFWLSKMAKKFLTHALRSQNHVLAIFAAEILVHSKVFHHMIFNSLVYFLDSIYSQYILEFFLEHNLNYDSRLFFIYQSDKEEIKRLKLLILCNKRDEIAIEEIKRYHHMFNNEILECLILKEHKDLGLIIRIIACGLQMDSNRNGERNNGNDGEKRFFVDEYLNKSTLEMLVKLQPKITFDISEVLSDIEPKNDDITHFLVLAQHLLPYKPKTVEYIEKQKLTFLQCTELLNFYLSLTKRGICLDVPDIEWPSALIGRVNLLREYNRREHHLLNICQDANIELEPFPDTNILPNNMSLNERNDETIIVDEDDHQTAAKTDNIEKTKSMVYNTQKLDGTNDSIANNELSLQNISPQIGLGIQNGSPGQNTMQIDRPKKINFLEINNCKDELLGITGLETQKDISTMMDTKILASSNPVLEQNYQPELENMQVCGGDSNQEIYNTANLTKVHTEILSTEGKERIHASQKIFPVPEDGAVVRQEDNEEKTTNYLQEVMHLDTLSNEYFNGIIYLAERMLFLDIKELKKKFRFTYNNRGITVEKAQRIGIKRIKEDDINKVINYKTNTTFCRLHLCISKFIKPKEVSMEEFIQNFNQITDYEVLSADIINYLDVYFLDGKKFSFSVFDKCFYGEAFSLQAIVKSSNRKYLKMIKAMRIK